MSEPRHTKEELIEFATTHSDLGIRKAAAEALYQSGRADASIEMRDAIFARDVALAKEQIP